MTDEATVLMPAPRLAVALGTWFETPTPHGVLRLCAHVNVASASCAAEAAVALESCAELLAALDGWLGTDLAWRWPARMAQGLHGPSWPDPACQLLAPWALWRALPAPPPLLAQGLRWPEVNAVLALGRLPLDAQDLAALEPGGAVLLPPTPAAPGAPPTARLRAADEPAGAGLLLRWSPGALPVALRGAASTLPPEPAVPGGAWCEVRLGHEHSLPGRLLAGWAELPVPVADDGAGLWADGDCLALGQLVPWGDGSALLLDALCEAP